MLVCTLSYLNIQSIFAYLRIEAMKTFLRHVKRIAAGTHRPSEQLELPLHTAKGCQFTRHNMLMQDTVELGRSPARARLCSLIGFIWKPQLLLHILPYPLSQLRR